MSKKELLAQNQRLTEKLVSQEEMLADLHRQIETLTDENRFLKEEMERQGAPTVVSVEETAVNDSNEAPITELPQQPVQPEPAVNVPKETDFEFLQNDMPKTEGVTPREYAVQMIARIVLESARVGCLLGKAPAQLKQDLLQLALGRTEVAKAEIFRILNEPAEAADQIEAISLQTKQACDYLSGLLLQIPADE